MFGGYEMSTNSAKLKINQSATQEMDLKKKLWDYYIDELQRAVAVHQSFFDMKYHKRDFPLSQSDLEYYGIFFALSQDIQSVTFFTQSLTKIQSVARAGVVADSAISMDFLSVPQIQRLQSAKMVARFTEGKNKEHIFEALSYLPKQKVYALLQVGVSSLEKTIMESNLFHVALKTEDTHDPLRTMCISTESLFGLCDFHQEPLWIDGRMYASKLLGEMEGLKISLHLASKATFKEISSGMTKMFFLLFVPLLLVSLALSYLLSKFHYQIMQKLTKREDLLIQESKMIEIGEMTSYLVHQWKQSLNRLSTTIVSLMAEMRKLDVGDRLFAKANLLEEYVEDFSHQIDNFHKFYRFSKKKEHFSITQTFQDIYRFVEYPLAIKEIELTMDTEEFTLYGYQNEWMQVMLSILFNMIEAFSDQEKKQINIHSKKEERLYILKIEDNAGGVAYHIENEIFQKYATTKEGGSGLGLYFAKVILQEHFGASISYEKTEDGSCFVIKFDIINSQKDQGC